MGESKNWVTVKIPEPIRDEARDDNRTYGQIMKDGIGGDSTPNDEPIATGDASMVRSVVSDEIQKHLSEISVSVDMSELDLDGSNLDESDVRNVVESELENTFGDRLPQ